MRITRFGQNVRQRRIGRDQLQHPALSDSKEFFLFALSDIAANNHPA